MNTSPQTSGTCQIVVKQAPFFQGLIADSVNVGHSYLQVIENGKVVCEINGLAVTPSKTDPLKGTVPKVGEPTDILQAIVSTKPRWEGQENHPSQVLATVSKEELPKILQGLKETAEGINGQRIPYEVLGKNSNAVFSTLTTKVAELANVPNEILEKAKAIGGFNPGAENTIPVDKGTQLASNATPSSPVNTLLSAAKKWITDIITDKINFIAQPVNFIASLVFPPKPEDIVAIAPPADTSPQPRSANRSATPQTQTIMVQDTLNVKPPAAKGLSA